ncbi:MAG: hypothetical protein JRN62_02910 [Nitrososphaerota archaeon]|nr:hypothetical protein [Nitrososphaerota archaeon]MDG6948944.1 hypothetical protein [Nitrososphaerota archaeon]
MSTMIWSMASLERERRKREAKALEDGSVVAACGCVAIKDGRVVPCTAHKKPEKTVMEATARS